MISPRSQLIEFIEQEAIPVEKIGDTLIATKYQVVFINRFLFP